MSLPPLPPEAGSGPGSGSGSTPPNEGEPGPVPTVPAPGPAPGSCTWDGVTSDVNVGEPCGCADDDTITFVHD